MVLDSSHFLVQSLIEDGLISEGDAHRAREHAGEHACALPDALVAVGAITHRQLAISRAKLCEYPFVDLVAYDVDINNANLIPRAMSERLSAFVLFRIGDVSTVAMLDPLNLQSIDQVRQVLRTDVDPVLCDAEQLRALIARAYSLVQTDSGAPEPAHARAEASLTTGDEPIVAAVNQVIVAAIDAGASDIHLNPEENTLNLRYRLDGVLVPQQGPPRSAHEGMVQRLKVMAKLDLTQTRRPQDGKFRFVHRNQNIDVRLSLVPTIHGENVVMRLLRPATAIGDVKDLGMPRDATAWFEQMIAHPHGMILVTGPTGSGKTTTLYTALSKLNSPERNIMTIEDPVEIRLPLVRQVQVNAEIGLTFASALRSFLRQDPDVILVGEIRDEETARIATQAALTGHLVFSTLHTNDAVGAVSRLRDLSVPAFAINNALLCAIAQRLVRRVCEGCVQPHDADATLLREMGIRPDMGAKFVRGSGCPRCLNTGYRGRVGVYEMLRVTTRVRDLIDANASVSDIRRTATDEGMRLMWHDGLEKASLGLTTLDELAKLRGVQETEERELRLSA
ncbi:MAG: type II/IV secretion system protein [Leptolyngbya sp. PLA2]|nr:type II/IV secretion system protein [Leptolyngbya sp.]MCE7970864.1 type II/IV secretion system protein [Leptolyngbya sp. PL-A2]MCQ3940321.1 type II secretion system protein GspE [cyanobacterium CYA1]MCZ7633704.1 GspE/PulE family protein [Phycisphaerales bacterium]MDL1904609.1 type II/IV secretion system protein [Synechococcales cyanobacterium CNB]GIK17859.1 MAG: general secretion pathway protein GspE [Planctomycetota bacterium]